MDIICNGKKIVVLDIPRAKRIHFLVWGTHHPYGFKRLRLQCPVCGRRLKSSVTESMDGDQIIHQLPPHKVKKWWKKKKKETTDKGFRRRNRR